jgi:hypothetical protein
LINSVEVSNKDFSMEGLASQSKSKFFNIILKKKEALI